MGCSASVSQNSQASRDTFSSGSRVRWSMYWRNTHRMSRCDWTRHVGLKTEMGQLTSTILCMCGMSRSIRTSRSMTRALHTFFLTSESSSAASANRLWWNNQKIESYTRHKDQQVIWCLTWWKYLDKHVNVVHEGLCSADDKLVHAGNSMRPTHPQNKNEMCYNVCSTTGSRSLKQSEKTSSLCLWNVLSNQPDLGAAVLKKLEKFGNHDVERPIERITVQQLGRVLADLLQSSKWALCVKRHTSHN